MKKLLDSVKKIVKSLDTAGVTFVTEDNHNGSLEYIDVSGHEIIVEDDSERDSWGVSMKIEKKEGVNLQDLLIETLGEPSRVHQRTGDKKVLNWEPKKNLLIVSVGDNIDIIQYYTRR